MSTDELLNLSRTVSVGVVIFTWYHFPSESIIFTFRKYRPPIIESSLKRRTYSDLPVRITIISGMIIYVHEHVSVKEKADFDLDLKMEKHFCWIWEKILTSNIQFNLHKQKEKLRNFFHYAIELPIIWSAINGSLGQIYDNILCVDVEIHLKIYASNKL